MKQARLMFIDFKNEFKERVKGLCGDDFYFIDNDTPIELYAGSDYFGHEYKITIDIFKLYSGEYLENEKSMDDVIEIIKRAMTIVKEDYDNRPRVIIRAYDNRPRVIIRTYDKPERQEIYKNDHDADANKRIKAVLAVIVVVIVLLAIFIKISI